MPNNVMSKKKCIGNKMVGREGDFHREVACFGSGCVQKHPRALSDWTYYHHELTKLYKLGFVGWVSYRTSVNRNHSILLDKKTIELDWVIKRGLSSATSNCCNHICLSLSNQFFKELPMLLLFSNTWKEEKREKSKFFCQRSRVWWRHFAVFLTVAAIYD